MLTIAVLFVSTAVTSGSVKDLSTGVPAGLSALAMMPVAYIVTRMVRQRPSSDDVVQQPSIASIVSRVAYTDLPRRLLICSWFLMLSACTLMLPISQQEEAAALWLLCGTAASGIVVASLLPAPAVARLTGRTMAPTIDLGLAALGAVVSLLAVIAIRQY
jgi:hypothetical protein